MDARERAAEIVRSIHMASVIPRWWRRYGKGPLAKLAEPLDEQSLLDAATIIEAAANLIESDVDSQEWAEAMDTIRNTLTGEER